MKREKGKKNNVEILKVGMLLMFVGIFLLFVKLSINSNDVQKKSDSKEKLDQQTEGNESNQEDSIWTTYKNDEYSIIFSRPRLLLKREGRQTGDYEFFVMFEENQFSEEKGVALGVSKVDLDTERERIKNDIISQGNPKLTENKEMSILGKKAYLLTFEPEEMLLEIRSFFLIEKGDYVYSFSTAPEQMRRLIDSIVFLD